VLQCRCVLLAREVSWVRGDGVPSERDAGFGSEGQGVPAEQNNDGHREL